jgi:tetratricopeptide (TPR) repeat protein
VARKAELERLEHHLREAFEGVGRTVLLYGEAGIGKTRLADELVKHAGNSTRILYGRCVPHNLSPYLVFVDALEELFEINPDDSRITRRRKIGQTTRDLGIRGWISGHEKKGISSTDEEMFETLPIIEGIMKAETGTSRKYPELGPESKVRRDWFLESVAELLLRSSRQKPILMILDDLHWADPSSLGLLHYLARNIAKTRALILGTYRTEELGEAHEGRATLLDALRLMRREDLLVEIALERFEPQEVAELLRTALGNNPPSELAEVLYNETEGNPLFVIEVLRLLIQERLLVREDNSWRLSVPVEKLEVPEKVHEVISRRLDRLTPFERDVLECSSVLGDRFDSHLLEKILKVERTRLVRTLSDLEKKYGLIHYSKGGYQFDHSKIREVLYQEIGEELRMNYHIETAENLAKGHEMESDPPYSTIAYHYYTGGVGQKALECYLKAADVARKKFAFEESILHLNEALRILGDKAPLETTQALEGLGDLYDITGHFTKATESWKHAIALQEDAEHRGTPESVARLYRKIASAFQVRGELPSASAMVESGLVALRNASSPERGWLEMVSCQSDMLLEKWQPAREHGKGALRIFQDLHVPLGEAQALQALGRIEVDSPRGDPSAAEHFLTEALDLSRSFGDLESTASVHQHLARLFAGTGNIEKAMKHIAAIEELPGGLHDPHKRRALLMLKGWMNAKVKGDFETSEANFREAMILAQKIQDPVSRAAAKLGQAFVAYYRGQFAEARRRFEECQVDLKAHKLFSYTVESMCMAAECCLLEGDREGFHRIVTGLKDPELQTGVQARLIMTQAIQGMSLIIEGDPDGSRRVFSKVMQLAESEPEVEQTPFAHYTYGVVLRVMGEDSQATEHLDQAAKLLKTLCREGILTTLLIREDRLTETLRRFYITS